MNNEIEALSKIESKQLAKLLWEHGFVDSVLREKCELLIASQEKNKLEKLIRKKIKALSKNSHFYDWREASSFADELDYLREMITDGILPHNPELAAELLEAFIVIDGNIIESVDDSSGSVGQVLDDVVHDWVVAMEEGGSKSLSGLVDKIYTLFKNNHYGVRSNIISQSNKLLGEEGINILEQKFKATLEEESDEVFSKTAIRAGLLEIAKLKQDMASYIDYMTDSGKTLNSMVLSKIIERFLECNQAEKALEWLNKYKGTENQAFSHDYLALKIHECLGNAEAIKEARWVLFKKTLRVEDFKVVLALSNKKEQSDYREEAIKVACNHNGLVSAMHFLISIDACEEAVELLHQKYKDVDGEQYDALKRLAIQFEQKECYLESILIYRRLAESILDNAQSKYYRYAVSYIKKSEKLANNVLTWKKYPSPATFIEGIRQTHIRKYAFWSKYKGASC